MANSSLKSLKHFSYCHVVATNIIECYDIRNHFFPLYLAKQRQEKNVKVISKIVCFSIASKTLWNFQIKWKIVSDDSTNYIVYTPPPFASQSCGNFQLYLSNSNNFFFLITSIVLNMESGVAWRLVSLNPPRASSMFARSLEIKQGDDSSVHRHLLVLVPVIYQQFNLSFHNFQPATLYHRRT